MLDWYESVSERLRIEAEAVPLAAPARVSLETTSESAGESGDERTETAKYLSNPMYRDHAGRPSIVRRFSRPSPRQALEDRGRAVANRVRHFISPELGRHRRRSLPERQNDEYFEDEDATPTSAHPPDIQPHYRPRRTSHQRTSPDSGSDSMLPQRRPSRSPRRDKSPRRERNEYGSKHGSATTSPLLRHHRSHELPTSPREYFPPYYSENERRHSIIPAEEKSGGFAPSKAPFFAAQLSQLQKERSRTSPRAEESRVYAGPRGTYAGRPTVSYSRRNIDPISERESRDRPVYPRGKRSHDRDVYAGRSQSYDPYAREEDRSPPHRYVEGTKGRRYPVETPWR
jgi:hypothetical protein